MSAQVKPIGLRGTKPKNKKGRLKAFIYGESGSGKSYFCTHFSKPYYIDTEKGVERAKYVDNIEKRDGVVFQTRSFSDIYQEVRLLATTEHDYQTLVIDPITPVYNNLVDECLERFKGKTAYGQHYAEAGKKFQKLIDLLLAIDMNVLITAHVKKEYGSEMNVIGTTFDAYKKFNFLFDVVIETLVRKGRYIGIAKKSRLVSLEPDQEIDFSYQEFSKLFKQELEYFIPKKIVFSEEETTKKQSAQLSVVQKKLTEGTQEYLNFLLSHMKITPERKANIASWAKVNNLDELSEEQAISVIRILEKESPESIEAFAKFSLNQEKNCEMEGAKNGE